MNDEQLNKELKKSIKQMNQLKQNADKSIGFILNSAKSMMTPEQHKKYVDLTGRILKARLQNDNDKVESLTKDMEKIFEENKE